MGASKDITFMMMISFQLEFGKKWVLYALSCLLGVISKNWNNFVI